MALGVPHLRADGRLKVTGAAKYTADYVPAGLAYAVLVTSTIAKGRVIAFDTDRAEHARGVIKILTHLNAPRLHDPRDVFDPTKTPPPNLAEVSTNVATSVVPLRSGEIEWWGQIVAVVVGETFEAAQGAAELVEVRYAEEHPDCSTTAGLPGAETPSSFMGKPIAVVDGDPDTALALAERRVDAAYDTPIHNHHPMEMQATLAEWRAGELHVEEPSRFVQGVARSLAQAFGIPDQAVHVRGKFVGGAFGSKGVVRPHIAVAALCAKVVGRPVKLVLTRRQVTFTSGHRPDTQQRVALGSDLFGSLVAISHRAVNSCSASDPFIEHCTELTGGLYAAPNRRLGHKIVRLNVNQPCNMRGPGEVPGMYALECALDEMAHELSMDPIELRRRNEPEKEPVSGKEFSCRRLQACIERGAAAFGWAQRPSTPRTLRRGDWLIGYGYASCTYPMKGSSTKARVRIRADGRIVVESATHEFGNGISTTARQIAADTLGVGYDDVTFLYADSDLPSAMQTGGSTTTMWVGTPIRLACEDVAAQLRTLGAVGGETAQALGAIVRKADRIEVVSLKEAVPDEETQKRYAMNSYGAHFCEVAVHADTCVTEVRRLLSVLNCGRILNPLLARGNYIGAATMAIGMALMEANELDPRTGMWTNAELADYHVPVYADTHALDVIFLDDPDYVANPLGVHGLGEMGLIGAPAAIANAVFNATGKRIRDLPITPDKLL